jgi:hypothetical protein
MASAGYFNLNCESESLHLAVEQRAATVRSRIVAKCMRNWTTKEYGNWLLAIHLDSQTRSIMSSGIPVGGAGVARGKQRRADLCEEYDHQRAPSWIGEERGKPARRLK